MSKSAERNIPKVGATNRFDPSCVSRKRYRPYTAWDQQDLVGFGAFSDVYRVCKVKKTKESKEGKELKSVDDCGYVLKVLKNVKDLNREAVIATKMGKIGVGPKVYNFWECDNMGFILMQYLNWPDLETFKERDYSLENNRGQRYREIKNILKTKVEHLLNLMHSNGFYHNDLHSGNILVSDDGKSEPNVLLIDFGKSSPRSVEYLDDESQLEEIFEDNWGEGDTEEQEEEKLEQNIEEDGEGEREGDLEEERKSERKWEESYSLKERRPHTVTKRPRDEEEVFGNKKYRQAPEF